MGRVGVSSGADTGRLFDHAAGGTGFVYATDRYICAYRQTGIFEVSGRGKVEICCTMYILLWADRKVQVHRLAGIYPAFFVSFW